MNASELDTNLANKARSPLSSPAQTQLTTLELRRNNCQRRTPNSSPVVSVVQQRKHQNKTTNQTSTTKGFRNGRSYLFFSNHNPNPRRRTLFGSSNTNNNYYSSKLDRSIVNCEKFLPDQELMNSTKENDLLLIHARQSARFV
jgi:hypothetical protein